MLGNPEHDDGIFCVAAEAPPEVAADADADGFAAFAAEGWLVPELHAETAVSAAKPMATAATRIFMLVIVGSIC
ncbi:MAG: hypothetical protein WDM88_13285 [Galbitalea sp.]